MARGRIGDLLHNQTWPPSVSPGPSTDGATTITNDEGTVYQGHMIIHVIIHELIFQIVKRDHYWTSHFQATQENIHNRRLISYDS